MVEVGGDFLADFDGFVEGLCEGFAFEDGHPVGDGDLADPGSEEAGAFGDDSGRAHVFGIVADGDGELGGVGDDDVGLGDVAVDALQDHFAGELAAAALDGLVAFHALGFILDFLLGHADVFFEFPLVIDPIHGGEDEEGDGDPPGDGVDDAGGDGEVLREVEADQGEDEGELLVDFGPGDEADEE